MEKRHSNSIGQWQLRRQQIRMCSQWVNLFVCRVWNGAMKYEGDLKPNLATIGHLEGKDKT